MNFEEQWALHERLGDEYLARCARVGLVDFPMVGWLTSPDGETTVAEVYFDDWVRMVPGPGQSDVPASFLPLLVFDLVMDHRARLELN